MEQNNNLPVIRQGIRHERISKKKSIWELARVVGLIYQQIVEARTKESENRRMEILLNKEWLTKNDIIFLYGFNEEDFYDFLSDGLVGTFTNGGDHIINHDDLKRCFRQNLRVERDGRSYEYVI
jgi:hypothetical protein